MSSAASRLQVYADKPRVFILSDISNEPDDAESLCRYLLYANQFDTEGLVACTSTWMKDRVCPQDIEKIVDAYGKVVDNLNQHVHPKWQYPSAQSLKALIRKGAETYGMTAVGDDIPLSPGSQLLLSRILIPTHRPLWVLCWSGTNTLAQVLLAIDRANTPEDTARILSRLRIYALSDRDDSGLWIRQNFPDIFYISSVHGWNQYGMAAWTGISGERFYGFDQGGPDFAKWEKEWLKRNIQIGPLGEAYPDYVDIPEADTPTFLYLIQNGLGIPEHPHYGSWGGRYMRTDGSASSSSSSSSGSGGQGNHYSDAVDRVLGQDGRIHTSNHATIWRWRSAFQNDFAARIQWSLSSEFGHANHHPVVSINGATGTQPVRIAADPGSTVKLDATWSYDPDASDTLTFRWWQYKEPSATQWDVEAEVAELEIRKLDGEGRVVEVGIPRVGDGELATKGRLLHLILEVMDSGTPRLTSYRRVLIQVAEKKVAAPGGGGRGAANASGGGLR
ncbi:DUF1593-domain-containing protein [Sporormia fimetaria CBS 119925]|uniref:DUF1593-domain-containing protein n=1 Tax=Sporormia fimetaria CBS 119925 TaxID=1340428 RepID=A0A6A6VCH7_9PLEO|nr:DUF1593-domain-containing protein [Sporormia fimetaria CBS 119925]